MADEETRNMFLLPLRNPQRPLVAYLVCFFEAFPLLHPDSSRNFSICPWCAATGILDMMLYHSHSQKPQAADWSSGNGSRVRNKRPKCGSFMLSAIRYLTLTPCER